MKEGNTGPSREQMIETLGRGGVLRVDAPRPPKPGDKPKPAT